MVKSLPAMQETWIGSLGWEYPLEKEMTTYSSILAWKIPRTEELGRFKSTVVRWLNIESIIKSEVSQKEKNK